MLKSITTFWFFMVLISYNSYSQTEDALSIKTIRSKIENLGISLKSDVQLDKMYLDVDDEGKRWIYIELLKMDGLRSDQYSLSREITEQIVKMLFKTLNYDLEETLNLKSFVNILESKNIKGVQFKTKNNCFNFNWTEILGIE